MTCDALSQVVVVETHGKGTEKRKPIKQKVISARASLRKAGWRSVEVPSRSAWTVIAPHLFTKLPRDAEAGRETVP